MTALEKYLSTRSLFGIKPGLEATRELCRRAGNPERKLKFLHIAGTNGKGSTCAMLERALREVGFHTGFYSSPHLVKINERFKMDGRSVSDRELNSAARELIAEAGDLHVSYFEFATVLAMKLFLRRNVNYVIWETGMGGRLDATNVVTPEISVITNIALDHITYLGDTLEKIAGEKAGIIKPGVPAFAGIMPDGPREVIAAAAKQQHAPFVFIDPATRVEPRFRRGKTSVMQEFCYHGYAIRLPLPGAMQRRNFFLVYQILETLSRSIPFDFPTALAGIAKTRWAGRCQYLRPGLILDGGHNPDGIQALSEALAELYPGEKFTIMFGAFRDKAVAPSLRMLSRIAKEFLFTPLSAQDRPSRTPENLKEELAAIGSRVPARLMKDAREGLDEVEKAESGVICGSLFLAGDILKWKGKHL